MCYYLFSFVLAFVAAKRLSELWFLFKIIFRRGLVERGLVMLLSCWEVSSVFTSEEGTKLTWGENNGEEGIGFDKELGGDLLESSEIWGEGLGFGFDYFLKNLW